MIRITRSPGGGRDLLRSYRVLVDGRVIGSIRRGESKEFPVEPGRHALELRIDWCGSRELAFDVKAGQVVEFRCEPAGNALQMWQLVTNVNTYIRLAPADNIGPPEP